jgi:SAM-dependent methyltransferase
MSTELRRTDTRDLFEQQWATYRAVLEHNGLNHKKIIDFCKREIAALAGAERRLVEPGLDLVDLGCGDGAVVAEVLKYLEPGAVRSFVGVDLTAKALDLAGPALRAAAPAAIVRLEPTDIRSFIADAPPSSFDVVLSSYCIHHFPLDEKAAMLAATRRALRPGGLLLLADVYQAAPEKESREQMMARWHHERFRQWEFLSEGQKDAVCEHTQGHDLPETLSTYDCLLQEAGFDSVRRLWVDDFMTTVYAAGVSGDVDSN